MGDLEKKLDPEGWWIDPDHCSRAGKLRQDAERNERREAETECEKRRSSGVYERLVGIQGQAQSVIGQNIRGRIY